MKKLRIKYFIAATLLAVLITGCKDKDYEDYKIQSDDNHGNVQKIISTAVTATSNDEFYANAVVPSTESEEIQLIPVVLNSRDLASQDIHVKLVLALDSLESYNSRTFDEFDEDTGELIEAHPENYYIMPGDPGTPAFTLVDDGVVTIPKGSSVGYLKIVTTTFDYFGDAVYAFPYRIESVKEPGYIISGNHNFGIVAVIPKNDYDGIYSVGPGKVQRFTGGTPNPATDKLQGTFTSLKDAALVTKGTTKNGYQPRWADDTGEVGGIDGTYMIIDPVVQPNGKQLVTMACKTNPSMVNIPGEINDYDPVTKTFRLAFQWGTANQRKYWVQLTYKKAR